METQNQQGDPAADNHSETENQSQQSTNHNATPPEQQSQQPEQPPAKEEPTFNKESLLADLHKERSQRKELTGKVQQLSEQVTKLTAVTEERDALQNKYNRLESFLEAFGGGISKALDSRSFTKELFESDKDVAELVAQWHKNNPSSVSAALNASSGVETSGAPSINDLLRAAK